MLAFDFSSAIEYFESLLEFLLWVDDDFSEHVLFLGLFVSYEKFLILSFRDHSVLFLILFVGDDLLLAHCMIKVFRVIMNF